MEELFIPYELAIALRELGFNEECLAYYNTSSKLKYSTDKSYSNFKFKAPTWGQVFDWFREHFLLEGLILPQDKSALDPLPLYFIAIESYKNGDWVEIFNSTNESTLLHYSDHYDARQACLEKLIELCKKEIK